MPFHIRPQEHKYLRSKYSETLFEQNILFIYNLFTNLADKIKTLYIRQTSIHVGMYVLKRCRRRIMLDVIVKNERHANVHNRLNVLVLLAISTAYYALRLYNQFQYNLSIVKIFFQTHLNFSYKVYHNSC